MKNHRFSGIGIDEKNIDLMEAGFKKKIDSMEAKLINIS